MLRTLHPQPLFQSQYSQSRESDQADQPLLSSRHNDYGSTGHPSQDTVSVSRSTSRRNGNRPRAYSAPEPMRYPTRETEREPATETPEPPKEPARQRTWFQNKTQAWGTKPRKKWMQESANNFLASAFCIMNGNIKGSIACGICGLVKCAGSCGAYERCADHSDSE